MTTNPLDNLEQNAAACGVALLALDFLTATPSSMQRFTDYCNEFKRENKIDGGKSEAIDETTEYVRIARQYIHHMGSKINEVFQAATQLMDDDDTINMEIPPF